MRALIDSIVAMATINPSLIALLAFFGAAAEAVVIVGAIVPGTAILLAVAALAGAQASASLALTILIAATLGAIAGDGFSYWLGRRFGRDLADIWPLSRHPGWLSKGEVFFHRHGGKSVFWGRFIPGVKTVVPVVAGMSEMSVGHFLLANISSAILWSLGLILGGLGVGRGLDRIGLADPRMIALLVGFLVILGIVYLLLRAMLFRGMPVLYRLHTRLIERLEGRQGRWAGMILRILLNEGGATVALIWAAVTAAAVIGFLAILAEVVFDAGFSQADAVISNAVQSLRFRALDAVMVAVTMAGDGVVLTVLAGIALVWLLVLRQWRAAGAAAVAFTATLLFVPIMKTILARQRPLPLYEGLHSFSFPSGHASHAMTVFGVLAILLAHDLALRLRLGVYFLALSLALMIALSRVYLGAHWPSDVAGGLLFGAAIVAALGFVLRARPLALHPGWMAVVLTLAYGGAYGLHMNRAYALWTDNYTRAPQGLELEPAAWRDDGWRMLPQQRISLGEESVQPFIAQYAGDPLILSRALVQRGWSLAQATTTQSFLSMLLPYGSLAELSPAIVLHDGLVPSMTLTGASDDGQRRLVLRIWPTKMILSDPDSEGKVVHLVELSAEVFTPFALGFGDLDMAPTSSVEDKALRGQIQAAPSLVASRQALDMPLLVEDAFLE